MQNEEIPPELPSTFRSIQTGPPIRRGDSWFYPVAPSRDEAAFHERNNFGFRNPQTHQNWIEIRRDGDAVETAVAYRVSLRLLPVARNQQNVRWVFLFAILLSMMFGIQIVFCNSASWSRSGNSFLGPSKFEMAKSSCIAGNLGWLVTEKTEIWRLFTSIFAVGNVVTFAITMLSLLFIAAPIERNIGGYIAVPLFFGPFVGIIASTYFLNDHVTTGGLSAIAAVLPLCYADYWKTKELSFLHCFGFAIFLIVMIMGYSPFTDNLTQLFAFLFGMATTGIYYSPERPSLTSQQVKSAQAGFLILLGFIFLLPLILLFISNPMTSGGDDASSAINGCLFCVHAVDAERRAPLRIACVRALAVGAVVVQQAGLAAHVEHLHVHPPRRGAHILRLRTRVQPRVLRMHRADKQACGQSASAACAC